MGLPFLVFSDSKGNIFSHPRLRMTVGARAGQGLIADDLALPKDDELISLPKGSTMFYLPGRRPVGFDPDTRRLEQLDDFDGEEVFAVAAFLIPGYLRLHNPSYIVEEKKDLPLWAYTACGFGRGRFLAAAVRIDRRCHQEPRLYDCRAVKTAIKNFEKKFHANRLYRHLAHCAINYNCLNAKNLFLSRWEAGIPTSPVCNARCLGCISLQDGCAVPASHQRLDFVPTPEEIAQLMVYHLGKGVRPMVSFGQGCEGEPLMQAQNIAAAISLTRKQTKRGRIHMNTNGSLPDNVKMLCITGIDSFRFSMNSANEISYNAYFRPRGYRFDDLIRSIYTAKKYGKSVAINLLTLPGVTDTEDEFRAWSAFIRETKVDMIQWRNLNIDPQYYSAHMPVRPFQPLGLLNMVNRLRQKFPKLKFGYFN